MSFSASLAAGAAANQWNANGPGSINYPHLHKKGSQPAIFSLTNGEYSHPHSNSRQHRAYGLSQFEGYRPPIPTICQPASCSELERHPSFCGFGRLAPQNRPRRHIILTTERNAAKMDIVSQYCEDVAAQRDTLAVDADRRPSSSLHAGRSPIPGSLIADLKRWSVAETRRMSNDSRVSEKHPTDAFPTFSTEADRSANPGQQRLSQRQQSPTPKKLKAVSGRKHIKGLCCSLLILTIIHSCLSCPLIIL